jgi:hypothetical protein
MDRGNQGLGGARAGGEDGTGGAERGQWRADPENLEERRIGGQPNVRLTGCRFLEQISSAIRPKTMRTLLKSGLMLGAVILAASLSGCVAVVAGAAGAGAVAYARGRLDAPLEADYDRAVRAANQAIKQLEFAKVSEKKDALEAILVARTAADRKVDIKVFKVSDQTSKVQIRVGFFGDETLSLTILDKIKINL